MSLTPAPRPNLSLTLQTLKPYREQYIPIVRRRIWEFWKLGCPAARGMSALNDPSVARQMAIVWATDGADIFTLQYYPNGDVPQVVADLPLSALPQAVADLRAAGF
jgi:hypothetical protein